VRRRKAQESCITMWGFFEGVFIEHLKLKHNVLIRIIVQRAHRLAYLGLFIFMVWPCNSGVIRTMEKEEPSKM
jgi:hypothetical protein